MKTFLKIKSTTAAMTIDEINMNEAIARRDSSDPSGVLSKLFR